MGDRALNLAKRYLDAHTAVLRAIEGCPEGSWSELCIEENETVGAVANHIAAGYLLEMQLVSAVRSGQRGSEIYYAEDDSVLDAYHAQASQQYSRYTKPQTLAHLRDNAAAAHRFLCQMDDADLEKPLDISIILKWFGRCSPSRSLSILS